MKMIMSKNEFIKSLARVQGVVERRNNLPILSYVLMKAQDGSVEISSTDLDVGLRATHKADVVEKGVITVMAKKAFEIARELPEDEVEIVLEEKSRVRLTSGKANFRMVGLPPEEYPQLPEPTGKTELWTLKKPLEEMIQKTFFAVSHDQTRYALSGILVEIDTDINANRQTCRMVATDGHRLAHIERNCLRGVKEERKFILPRKAILELKKVLDDIEDEEIRIDYKDNHLFFIGQMVTLTARLVEGQFPEYQQVIPKSSASTAVMDREELNRVLRRIAILNADRANPARFIFSHEGLKVSADNPDVGDVEESMTIAFEGESLELGFNPRYIQDLLAAVTEQRITLGMNKALTPGLFTVEGDADYQYVVMPMRL